MRLKPMLPPQAALLPFALLKTPDQTNQTWGFRQQKSKFNLFNQHLWRFFSNKCGDLTNKCGDFSAAKPGLPTNHWGLNHQQLEFKLWPVAILTTQQIKHGPWRSMFASQATSWCANKTLVIAPTILRSLGATWCNCAHSRANWRFPMASRSNLQHLCISIIIIITIVIIIIIIVIVIVIVIIVIIIIVVIIIVVIIMVIITIIINIIFIFIFMPFLWIDHTTCLKPWASDCCVNILIIPVGETNIFVVYTLATKRETWLSRGVESPLCLLTVVIIYLH